MRKFAALLLALTSCATPPQILEEKVVSEGKAEPKIKSTDAKRRYVFSCVSFKEFNPAPNAQDIKLDPKVSVVLENGLDFLDNQRPDTYMISNPKAFEDLIYDEARKEGYLNEELAYLSLKETALLTCKIAANRMNYFGILADFTTRKRRQQRIENMRSNLEAIAKSASVGEEDRKDTREKLEALAKIEEAIELQEGYERKLSATNGSIRRRLDAVNSESHLEQGNEVICRQYAITARKMHLIFKIYNTGLRNTYVATYSYNNHLWNQVSAVEERNGVVYITVSGYDPTRYDCAGDPEGFGEDHFDKNFSVVKLQLRKLRKQLDEQQEEEQERKK